MAITDNPIWKEFATFMRERLGPDKTVYKPGDAVWVLPCQIGGRKRKGTVITAAPFKEDGEWLRMYHVKIEDSRPGDLSRYLGYQLGARKLP